MNILLRAKHWQLFLLMWVPMVVSTIVLMVYYVDLIRHISMSPNDWNFDLSNFVQSAVWMTVASFFAYFIYGLWMWGVNVNLRRKLSPSLRDSTIRFGIVFLIPIIYLIVICFTMYYLFSGLFGESFLLQDLANNTEFGEEMLQRSKILFPINIGLYLLMLPAYLYLIYRTAKTLKKLEIKAEVTLSDSVTEIILMLFFTIVGIWFLQPKVNQYVVQKDWDDDQTPPPSPIA